MPPSFSAPPRFFFFFFCLRPGVLFVSPSLPPTPLPSPCLWFSFAPPFLPPSFFSGASCCGWCCFPAACLVRFPPPLFLFFFASWCLFPFLLPFLYPAPLLPPFFFGPLPFLVRAVSDRLRKEELVASVSKTDFFVRSVELCGHVSENNIPRPAPGKMLALERWEKPDNVRELRGFLGLANYCSGPVQNYASIATPLIEMLKNLPKHENGKRIGLTWNASANEAFLKLKRAIKNIVPLQLANWDKAFVLTPDASNWAVGAALQQEGPDGALCPLAFFSRILSGSQLN